MSGLVGAARAGETSRRLLLRFATLAGIALGLIWFTRTRAPRELELTLNLADTKPQELVELDLTVTRDGRALARIDRRFTAGIGAPELLSLSIHAPPGPIDLDATLIDAHQVIRRIRTTAALADAPTAGVPLHPE